MQDVISRLYQGAEDAPFDFQLIPESEVVPPHSMFFIEVINGVHKIVGCYDAGDPYRPEFVERSPLDGRVDADSDHPYALRQKALSLVGLREHTVVAGQRRYRFTDRAQKPVDEARVEEWLRLVVPEKPTR